MDDFGNKIKNQLSALRSMMIILAGLLTFMIYQAKNERYDKEDIKFTAFLIFLDLIPVMYLHLEYLFFSTRYSINISDNNRLIIYDNNGVIKMDCALEEITEINMFASHPWHRGEDFVLFPFSNYNYLKLNFSDGMQVIITCFMMSDIKIILRYIGKVKVVSKKRFFPSILLEKVFSNNLKQ